MVLLRMIFSPCMEGSSELYIHGAGEPLPDGGLLLRQGNTVSLDTYFNAFFYGAYLRHTWAERVGLRVTVSGNARLTLAATGQDRKRRELESRDTSGERQECLFRAWELSELPPDGMLYLELRANSGDVVLHGGCFETKPAEMRPVYAAAVICTYRREAYVRHNLDAIRRGVWEGSDPDAGALDVLVVDNGRSLSQEILAFCPEHISLFPNKNYGGSGGFARGMIEVWQRRDKYTHVLLMDDDITFEPETLLRTIRFLRVARPSDRPLCIGGQMLVESRPTVQFEAGARFLRGELKSNRMWMDLSKGGHLIENASPLKCDYNAWWYCCFSVSVIDKIGFPFPFFIRMDDVEYGLRMQPDIVVLNGIGVWHMDFLKKFSPHTEYYNKRNSLVVNAVYGGEHACWDAIKRMILSCGRAALLRDPQEIVFILRGYQDFMRGPAFFRNTDEEELNTFLLEEKKKPKKSRLQSILTDPFRLVPVIFRFLFHYRGVRREYREVFSEFTSLEFWRERLRLDNQIYKDAEMSGKTL